MSVWKPAQRMARRSIRRNLARSILIAMLIGLPVAVATFADVLYRSTESPAANVWSTLGDADAKLVVTNSERFDNFKLTSEWYGGPYAWSDSEQAERDPRTVDVEKLLPAGTKLEAWNDEGGGANLLLRKGSRYADTYLEQVALPSVLRPELMQLREGRFPKADEVVVSQTLADKLHLAPGDTVIDDLTATELPVSGIVRDQSCFRCEGVFAQPGQTLIPVKHPSEDESMSGGYSRTYLVDLPAGASPHALANSLAERGVILYPRDTYLHRDDYKPSRYWDDSGATLDQLRAAALTTLIVGLGLLEVILLAGAAFAVGARKQVRDMGLISAGGASPRQLRAVLLMQGAALGLVGTIGGVIVGFAVARLGWPLWEQLDGRVFPVFRFGPEILIAVVVGIVSGVLAAVVPAIGASRRQPLDALSGRFRISRGRSRRTTLIGGIGVAAGVVLGIIGSAQMAGQFQQYGEVLATAKQTGISMLPPTPTIPIALILLGAVLAIGGLVLAMPVVIGLLSRLGGRLPLSGRLAVRDADRHRHRTGPAASAIMLAVAGSVVAAFAIAGAARGDEARFIPSLPPHTMQLYTNYATSADEQATALAAALARVQEVVPEAALVQRGTLGYPIAQQAGTDAPELATLYFANTGYPGCGFDCMYAGSDGTPALADPTLIRLAIGRDLTDAESAELAAGKVLVTAPNLIDADGMVTAERDEVETVPDGSPAESGEPLTFPAFEVARKQNYTSMPVVFMTEETAQAHGLQVNSGDAGLVTFPAETTPAQEKAMLKAARAGHRTGAWMGDSSTNDEEIALLVVGGLAALVALIGVAIAVALSAAEGRRELATLSAVGAAPRVRRQLAGAQALVISGVGALVGVVLGTFVSYALRATFGAPSFTVPWLNLVGVGLGVPLLAALIVAACTRSKAPVLERRV